jgi:hypothetical protein
MYLEPLYEITCGLGFQPRFYDALEWKKLIVFYGNCWAENPETRVIVTGFVINADLLASKGK